MTEDLGKIVWQERPAKYVFIAREGKRIFDSADIAIIHAQLRKARKEHTEMC